MEIKSKFWLGSGMLMVAISIMNGARTPLEFSIDSNIVLVTTLMGIWTILTNLENSKKS